jgi:hypothetical protein
MFCLASRTLKPRNMNSWPEEMRTWRKGMDASRKQRWPMQKDGGKSRWNEVHTRAQHQEVSEEEAALDTVKTLGGRPED